jgi:NAD-dependent deacetylase
VPNPAHLALVEAERLLADRFLLLTQNVDGLHLRAGNTLARTYQVHGNIDYLRCEHEHPALRPVPDGLDVAWAKDRKLTADEIAILKCCEGSARSPGAPPHGSPRERALLTAYGRSSSWSRPHVLWFDESYDEPLFRFESSLQASLDASMLIVVGTSGATTLPTYVVAAACKRNIPLVCINADPSPFTRETAAIENGLVLLGTAGEHMPRVLDALRASRA